MTPPSKRVAKTDSTPRDADIERLLHGRLHEPRRVLGMHAVGADEVVVRVLLPNALQVQLLDPAAQLERVPGTALFEWKGPRGDIASRYSMYPGGCVVSHASRVCA